jgi:hypothetical protein
MPSLVCSCTVCTTPAQSLIGSILAIPPAGAFIQLPAASIAASIAAGVYRAGMRGWRSCVFGNFNDEPPSRASCPTFRHGPPPSSTTPPLNHHPGQKLGPLGSLGLLGLRTTGTDLCAAAVPREPAAEIGQRREPHLNGRTHALLNGHAPRAARLREVAVRGCGPARPASRPAGRALRASRPGSPAWSEPGRGLHPA